MRTSLHLAVLAAALATSACGGSSGPPPADHTVTISWQPNHEKGVNGPGGGYRVTIAGRLPVDLPYDVGAGLAPTSITTVLFTGPHGVTVNAYQPAVVGAGTTVSPPATMTVVVP